MAIITSRSKFTPFTYEEKVKPIQTYLANVDKADEYYTNILNKTSQIGALIDPIRDKEASKIYQAYEEYINKAMDDLYKNGLTPTNRAMFNQIRKEGIPKMTELTSDIARSEKAKEAFGKVWYGKEHDFIGRNPYDISLDEWLGGKTPDTKGFSSNELANYVAAGVKAISDRANTIFEENGYIIDQRGLSEEQIQAIIRNLGSNSKFDNSTLEGKYLNMILEGTKDFLYNDVFVRYGITDDPELKSTNSFYSTYEDKLNSAIGTGLRTGYGYASNKSKITTDKDGEDGGDGLYDPTAGLNVLPGNNLPSVQGEQAKTVNAMTRVTEAKYEPLELSDGTIIQDPVEAYNVLIPKLDDEYNNLERQRQQFTNIRDHKYKAIVSRQNAIQEDKNALNKHFKGSKQDVKVINKKSGKQIESIEDVHKIQESSYNNRVTDIPSHQLVGPSISDDLKSVISERMLMGIDTSSRKTNVYKMKNYTQGKAIKSSDIYDIFGDAGENIGSIEVSVKTLFDDPENPYAMIYVNRGNNKGQYKVPLYTIVGSQDGVNIFMSEIVNGLNEEDITEIESWGASNDDRSGILESNIERALGNIRMTFNTAYHTESSSKSKRN